MGYKVKGLMTLNVRGYTQYNLGLMAWGFIRIKGKVLWVWLI